MRNMMKAATLESKFPLLAVEHGCIVSKDADLTAAFEVELPEVYSNHPKYADLLIAKKLASVYSRVFL